MREGKRHSKRKGKVWRDGDRVCMGKQRGFLRKTFCQKGKSKGLPKREFGGKNWDDSKN
ncbi:MAG: hypothetical protein NZ805_05505 [Armatimonadetes bacterium]|nr:hypothetical protein [Armatimonadota bacterium]